MEISTELPEEELLLQAAEESAELAMAAIKLIRIRHGINPSPVSESAAEANLLEEIADAKLCIEELSKKEGREMVIAVIYANKKERWKRRLMEAKENE